MTHSAKIIADSVSPDGVRLTTMEVTFPRIVLAEFNTHRMFSRNSASSRAIPVEKMIRMVNTNPYVPTHWGKNQRGMQADEELHELTIEEAKDAWLRARDEAVQRAAEILQLGVHKQITNRLLEPFMWHTVIVTATEWSNFFNLRCDPAAHPEIRLAAEEMLTAMEGSTPRPVDYGEWHTPYVEDGERFNLDVNSQCPKCYGRGLVCENPNMGDTAEWLPCECQGSIACKVSVGRCARVSYLTHDGVRDPVKDVELHDKLLGDGHMSPFEHVARPMTRDDRANAMMVWNETDEGDNGYAPVTRSWSGNFRGWVQYRKEIPHEHDVKGAR